MSEAMPNPPALARAGHFAFLPWQGQATREGGELLPSPFRGGVGGEVRGHLHRLEK